MKLLYAANPGLKREHSTRHKLKINYGLTPEDRVAMLEAAGYKCEICDREVLLPTAGCGKDNANIDHDHSTGKVRGILCGHCNKGLGHFLDSKELLSRAISYLSVRT